MLFNIRFIFFCSSCYSFILIFIQPSSEPNIMSGKLLHSFCFVWYSRYAYTDSLRVQLKNTQRFIVYARVRRALIARRSSRWVTKINKKNKITMVMMKALLLLTQKIKRKERTPCGSLFPIMRLLRLSLWKWILFALLVIHKSAIKIHFIRLYS